MQWNWKRNETENETKVWWKLVAKMQWKRNRKWNEVGNWKRNQGANWERRCSAKVGRKWKCSANCIFVIEERTNCINCYWILWYWIYNRFFKCSKLLVRNMIVQWKLGRKRRWKLGAKMLWEVGAKMQWKLKRNEGGNLGRRCSESWERNEAPTGAIWNPLLFPPPPPASLFPPPSPKNPLGRDRWK